MEDYIRTHRSDFSRSLPLPFADGIRAGFPSEGPERLPDFLDFNRDLIRHPEATFYGHVCGDSMIEAGISNGDIAVIDRDSEAYDGDIIVAYINNEFTIKRLDLSEYQEGYIILRPANPAFAPIRVKSGRDDFKVWGVVIMTIKKWKR